MAFSVGLGLTNECNLRCPHCYRPDTVVQRLTLRDVRQACESIQVRSVNLGVGENGLHTEYEAILDYLGTRALKTSITSNGLSIRALDDAAVKRFHSVELSLDFPREPRRLRPTPEPVVAAVLRTRGLGGPVCARSTARVAPDGRVLPCTHWPESRLTPTDRARLGGAILDTAEFVDARRVPTACRDCPCRGGCAGRRALAGRLDAPDPYCPFARGEQIALDWERTKREDLPKMASACTTVVSAR